MDHLVNATPIYFKQLIETKATQVWKILRLNMLKLCVQFRPWQFRLISVWRVRVSLYMYIYIYICVCGFHCHIPTELHNDSGGISHWASRKTIPHCRLCCFNIAKAMLSVASHNDQCSQAQNHIPHWLFAGDVSASKLISQNCSQWPAAAIPQVVTWDLGTPGPMRLSVVWVQIRIFPVEPGMRFLCNPGERNLHCQIGQDSIPLKQNLTGVR